MAIVPAQEVQPPVRRFMLVDGWPPSQTALRAPIPGLWLEEPGEAIPPVLLCTWQARGYHVVVVYPDGKLAGERASRPAGVLPPP